jgi:DNA-binding XRE family transcriptional regulator
MRAAKLSEASGDSGRRIAGSVSSKTPDGAPSASKSGARGNSLKGAARGSARSARPGRVNARVKVARHLIPDVVAPDGSRWVMLPRIDYDELCAELDGLRQSVTELAAYRTSEVSRALPIAVGEAIARGVPPIKAWREHRKMTQAELAAAAGVSSPAIHYIETGATYGRRATRNAIADALRAPIWALEPFGTDKLYAQWRDRG